MLRKSIMNTKTTAAAEKSSIEKMEGRMDLGLPSFASPDLQGTPPPALSWAPSSATVRVFFFFVSFFHQIRLVSSHLGCFCIWVLLRFFQFVVFVTILLFGVFGRRLKGF